MFYSKCNRTTKIAAGTHCREQCFSVAKIVVVEQLLRLGLTSSLEFKRRKEGLVVPTEKFNL